MNESEKREEAWQLFREEIIQATEAYEKVRARTEKTIDRAEEAKDKAVAKAEEVFNKRVEKIDEETEK